MRRRRAAAPMACRAIAVALVLGGCASARGSGLSTGRIPIGNDLAVLGTTRILTLPDDQRFRFVPADSLVAGVTSEDAASVDLPAVANLREGFAIVLRSHGWVASDESPDFDIAIFMVRRTHMVTRTREERVPLANPLPRCDLSRGGNQPRCSDQRQETTRTVRYSEPVTSTRTIHVIRRRSDGAVRIWGADGFPSEQQKAMVARDLLRHLFTDGG